MKYVFVLVLFLLFPVSVSASILVVKEDGEMVLNVLSQSSVLTLKEVEKDALLVTNVFDQSSFDYGASLTREEERVALTVYSTDGIKELDVTDYEDSLIEIEQQGDAKKVNIFLKDGKFAIEEAGVVAETKLPLAVDSEAGKLLAKTQNGESHLSILPFEAARSILTTRLITEIEKEGAIELFENEAGAIAYRVSGRKVIDVFGLIDYPIEVTTTLSGVTGEVFSIEDPKWLKPFSFLFI